MGAGAVFLLVGGPVRVARGIRRRLFRVATRRRHTTRFPSRCRHGSTTWRAPSGRGPPTRARSLSEELQRWRHDPKKHGKISKKLAKQIAEGPPGPRRVAWTAFEAGAAIVTAALARKMVERFLSGEPPSGVAPLDAAGTVGGAAKPDPKHAKNDVTKPPKQRARAAAADAREDYSGMSSRGAG